MVGNVRNYVLVEGDSEGQEGRMGRGLGGLQYMLFTQNNEDGPAPRLGTYKFMSLFLKVTLG